MGGLGAAGLGGLSSSDQGGSAARAGSTESGGISGDEPTEGGAGGSHDAAGEDGIAQGAEGGRPRGAGGAAGEVDKSNDDDGGIGGQPEPSDTTPPEIISVSPPDGAHTVPLDTDIVVTFSEPMDTAETEKAFVSDDFLPSQTTITWSDGGRTMTVHANEGLQYADPSYSSLKLYTYSITTFGRDIAGNHLTSNRSFSFDTGHIYAVSLEAEIYHLQHPSSGADDVEWIMCDTGTAELGVSQGLLSQFSFDTMAEDVGIVGGSLDEILDFPSATLTFVTGLDQSLVSIDADRISIEPTAVPDPPALTWGVPVLQEMGSFVVDEADANYDYRLDIGSGLKDDFFHRNERYDETQYFIRFYDVMPSKKKTVVMEIPCNPGIRIDLTYLLP